MEENQKVPSNTGESRVKYEIRPDKPGKVSHILKDGVPIIYKLGSTKKELEEEAQRGKSNE